MNSIIFDCERMKYAETGIYYYCLNLGARIRERLDPTQQLSFYAPKNTLSALQGTALWQSKRHKLFMPSLSGHTVWHSTYQHSDYIPSRCRNIQVLLTVHDLNFMYDEQLSDAKKEKYLRELQKRIDRADAIVCVSEYSRKDVLAFCLTGAKPVYVIHNGTNALESPLLNEASFKPARPFLFSIGAIRRKKNFHALLPLVKQNRHLDLVIAGKPEDAEYLHDLEHMAREEGVRERLHLLGKISEGEKSWYYHNCKAFVLASLAEGFGLPLVEAMSVGKPVFLSNKTALPEIGSNAAFYFSDFSEACMQDSFIRGMHQYDIHNMTDMIKKHAESFSWENAADEYIKLYQHLYNQR